MRGKWRSNHRRSAGGRAGLSHPRLDISTPTRAAEGIREGAGVPPGPRPPPSPAGGRRRPGSRLAFVTPYLSPVGSSLGITSGLNHCQGEAQATRVHNSPVTSKFLLHAVQMQSKRSQQRLGAEDLREPSVHQESGRRPPEHQEHLALPTSDPPPCPPTREGIVAVAVPGAPRRVPAGSGGSAPGARVVQVPE